MVSPGSDLIQTGSDEKDEILGASAGSGGSVVLSGFTNGNWSGTHRGSRDYTAMKLDSDGEVVWRLQVTAAHACLLCGALTRGVYQSSCGRQGALFYYLALRRNLDTVVGVMYVETV